MSFFCQAFFQKSVDQAATVHFLCQAFFLAKESGEGRDTSFPSPQTPLPQEPSRDCCGSLGSSLGGMRRLLCGGDRQTGFAGRQTAAPYGLPGRSFHGVTGFCSSSAHPRNFCCVGFARMALLAKFIRMRTARSHPRGARTRALNVPRRASTNIGNRAKQKKTAKQCNCLYFIRTMLYYPPEEAVCKRRILFFSVFRI